MDPVDEEDEQEGRGKASGTRADATQRKQLPTTANQSSSNHSAAPGDTVLSLRMTIMVRAICFRHRKQFVETRQMKNLLPNAGKKQSCFVFTFFP